MKSKSVLLSGPTIVEDEELVGALAERAEVVKSSDCSRIQSVLRRAPVDAILFEILDDDAEAVEGLRQIRKEFQDIPIIVIDGDGQRELLAQAFESDANDAFRKPYNRDLIAERVQSLLRHGGRQVFCK